MNCNCTSMNTERQYMTDFKLYDLEQALQVGTIFAELDKPFTGRGGMYRENCM